MVAIVKGVIDNIQPVNVALHLPLQLHSPHITAVVWITTPSSGCQFVGLPNFANNVINLNFKFYVWSYDSAPNTLVRFKQKRKTWLGLGN